LGTALIGSNGAFVQQYRFAAAESVPPERVGRAVSWVLAGGIVAAFLGPALAPRTATWPGHADYSLTFVMLTGLYLALVVLLLAIRNPRSENLGPTGTRRPLRQVASQPTFLLAVLAATVAYSVMTLVMTAAPVSMHSIDGHSLGATATVVQWHMAGMYVPVVLAGSLMAIVGLQRLMVMGWGAMVLGLLSSQTGHSVFSYWLALFLIGIGWSLLFVSATVLLTRTYSPEERFSAQALNDGFIFSMQGVASLSAGFVVYRLGWGQANLLMLIPMALLMAAMATWRSATVQAPAS
jgi:MFS family permease